MHSFDVDLFTPVVEEIVEECQSTGLRIEALGKGDGWIVLD